MMTSRGLTLIRCQKTPEVFTMNVDDKKALGQADDILKNCSLIREAVNIYLAF